MTKKEILQIKLIPEGESYIAYINGKYFKGFSSHFEAYKNELDAEEFLKEYFKQNGYDKIETTYINDEYIMEGIINNQELEAMSLEENEDIEME
ncbi:MAG: hypothetical protein HFF36_07860 [Coprobacillus sp.]|nr:hypothetical protein [Coprobacillus sp.]